MERLCPQLETDQQGGRQDVGEGKVHSFAGPGAGGEEKGGRECLCEGGGE